MGVRVIGIIELIQQLSFTTISHLQRQIARTFHALLFGDKNQFRTKARIAARRSWLMLSGISNFMR